MSSLPLKTRVYTLLLVLVTIGALGWAVAANERPWVRHDIWVALVLFGMIIMADYFQITFPLTVVNFEVSVNAVLALAAGLTLGPLHGAMVVLGAELVSELWVRRQLIKAVVNIANFGLATLAGATVYQAIALEAATPLHGLRNMLATVLGSLAFTLVNTWILAIIVSPVLGTGAVAMWWANYRGFYMQFATLPTLGSLVPVIAMENPFAVLLLTIPLLGPHLAAKGMRKVQVETQATMAGLADALERRDPYTHRHSIRVTEHVRAILAEMPEVPLETQQAITAAARIHDLGKVGTQDLALNKPGPLTPAERAEMQQHAPIGAEIVGNLEMYKECALIIRHHHEHWDGNGYPDGLQGEAIPLGARIIAVADSFDAMTSDRVYRPAMTPAEAMAELRQQSGSQFDPHVVAAFDRALNRFLAPPASVEPTRGAQLRQRLGPIGLAAVLLLSGLLAIIRHLIPPKS